MAKVFPTAASKRTPWSVLSALLVALMVFGGLQLAPAPAFADPADLGLTVTNGGVTQVNSYTDVVTMAAQISLPAGTSLQAGAVTTLTLDKTLKRTNNSSLPTGATVQSWDEQSNTLTVTWGALASGNVYAASVNATPSGIADQQSLFQGTATLVGTATGGGAVEQTSVSDQIAVGSAFPADFIQTSLNSWSLNSPLAWTVQPGQSASNYRYLVRGTDKSAFRNLQVETDWGVQNGSDGLLPRSWVTVGPRLAEGVFSTSTTLQDDGIARVFSYGAIGGPTTQGVFTTNVAVPAGTLPGTYSVPVKFLDDTDDSGITKRLVHETVLSIIVPAPEATAVTYTATRGPSQVLAGSVFEWQQTLAFSAPPSPLVDLTVILPIPEHTTARGIFAGFGTSFQATLVKTYEYTTDAVVDAQSAWQTLPQNNGAITLANPEIITGIRYVMQPLGMALAGTQRGATLTLQADEDLAVGTVLHLATESVTFVDPVAGPIALTPTPSFGKNVTIMSGAGAASRVAALDSPTANGSVSFDQTYANGGSFASRFFLGNDGLAALPKPYQFVVVPRGMAVVGQSAQACSPASWPDANGGCQTGLPLTYPVPSLNVGSIALSDGSTLYYSRMSQGQLTLGGYSNLQQLHTQMTFRPQTLLAGENKVLIGMGSMTQNDLAVSTAHSTRANYTLQSLSDPASYGSFASLGEEIQGKLAGLGIETDTAFMGERSFTISPATSVGSVTTIKGSEDSTGIVQGAGTATARPGGAVSYSIDVSNTGSLNYQNFQFIDTLPYQGDTYTLNAGASRGSAFDMNLSGNVKVLLNGVPTSAAIVEYTTSATPARFDAAGNDVAGDVWLPFTGSATGAKAIRVTLTPGVNFGPADKLTLSFDATVPASAPRDGSTANNTVAYRFQTSPGIWVAAETPSVAVKSSAPSGDTELSGEAFLDLNSDGIQQAGEPGLNGGGVALQLYKMVSGSPVATGSPVTPNTDAGTDGVFSFIGLDANETYRVKPVITNPNVTVVPAALDADGYLKYVQVTDATINGAANTAQYVGSSSFLVGDQVGAQKWIKDLRLPLTATTTVSGSLTLTDVTNTPMTAGTGSPAGPFVADYTVKLMQGSTQKASTTTDEAGAFTFTGMAGLTPGDYTLRFVSPAGRELVASALNNPTVFSGGTTPTTDGVYAVTALQPGTGASGITVYYTDTDLPAATAPVLTGGVVVDTTRFNPASAALSATDVGTLVKSFTWQVLDDASQVIGSGTVNASATGTASVTIPAGLTDGVYSLSVTATDLVGNISAANATGFQVDTTAPVISSTETSVSYVKGSDPAPVTSAGWISLYGVTATDTSSGMPATGGITVDAAAVDTTAAGSYTVTFTATDAAGNISAAYEVTYVVGYVADPTITLGTNTAFYEMGTTPPADDPAWKTLFGGVTTGTSGGATVADVSIDTSTVDYDTAGSYSVVFTVTDSLGYTATATGTLTVRDTIAPVITTAKNTLSYTDGDTPVTSDAGWIAAYGATATDTGSGVASLTVNASAVDYDRAGTYPVVFTAQDNAGNTSTKNVTYAVAFAGAPSVTVGNDPAVYEMGDQKPASQQDWIDLFDATATTAAGTTLQSLTADASGVDFNTLSAAGYDVVFTATDSYNNTFTYTAKLIVQDTKAPTVTIGAPTVKHAQQAPETAYTTADWLTMFDVTGADTTGGSGIDPAAWQMSEGVNYDVAGDYQITFTAQDIAGNVSAVKTATLTVQAPPTGDTVTMDVAQDQSVTLDPIGRVTTTGTLKTLIADDLGTPSAGGSAILSLLVNNRIGYTPAAGFSGEETFVVTVTDDLGQTAEITYVFTVVKAPGISADGGPEYTVPVDGAVEIPAADVLNAVDVAGLTLDKIVTPEGFHGTVKLDGDSLNFVTDGSNWSGDQSFTVTVKDQLGQTVTVPVTLHVTPPTLTIDKSEGYAGVTETTLTATGLMPGSEYSFELRSDTNTSDPIVLGTVTADEQGVAILSTTIPEAALAGPHQIVLKNAAGLDRTTVTFTVLATGGDTDGQDAGVQGPGGVVGALLALTGGNGFLAAGLAGALALLLGGLVFLLLWLRRRRDDEEESNVTL